MNEVMPVYTETNGQWREGVNAVASGPNGPGVKRKIEVTHAQVVANRKATRMPLASIVTVPGVKVRLRCFLCDAVAELEWNDRGYADDRLRTHVREVCPWTATSHTV